MTLELLEVREKCHFPYSSKTMGYINRKRRLLRCKVSNNKAEVLLTCDCQQIAAQADQIFNFKVSPPPERGAEARRYRCQVPTHSASALSVREETPAEGLVLPIRWKRLRTPLAPRTSADYLTGLHACHTNTNFGRTITNKLKALPAHWFPSQWPVHRIL